MSTQMRYPKEVNQISLDDNQWENLDNVLIDDWESLAVCQLSSGEKPNSFIVKNFKFNIPVESKIHTIDIRMDFHRDSSPNSIKLDPPTIRLVNTKENCVNNDVLDSSKTIEENKLREGPKIMIIKI